MICSARFQILWSPGRIFFAPDQPIGYYRLGLVYQAQKKFDQAITEFETALSKSPKATEPLVAIVKIYMAQGKADKAVARLNQAIQAAPDNFVAHIMLGEIYVSQKKYTEAESTFRKSAQINPKAPISYLNLSKLNLARGDKAAAIHAIQEGLQAVPGDASLSMALAESYQTTEDYDKAVTEYEGVLKRSPQSDVAANNLASILVDMKGDKKSLERALELTTRFEKSNNPAFVDTLGWTYLKLGQPDKALPLLKKAVDQAPQIAIFQYHLGLAYYKKGDVSSAKPHLQKAVDGKVNFPGLEEAKSILAKG